jgi:hypothetical protein
MLTRKIEGVCVTFSITSGEESVIAPFGNYLEYFNIFLWILWWRGGIFVDACQNYFIIISVVSILI